MSPPPLRSTVPRALVLTLAALSTSCIAAAVAVGAAGAIYLNGDREAELAGTLPEALAAVENGLHALDLPVLESASSGTAARLLSRTDDGDEIVISLEAVTPDRTRVSIRVGTFGDSGVDERIEAAIQRRLGR